VVHEVLVPETISVADLAHKPAGGIRGDQGPDEDGHDGDHQPGAGPGNRHDRVEEMGHKPCGTGG
jgi:hypothetical protein